MKIIGNTVGMGLPKPNLMQTDPSKGDYVKGKEEFLKQFGGSTNPSDSSLLVVTFTTDESGKYIPSHTFSQIKAWVGNGGSAVLTDGKVWYNLATVSASIIRFERTVIAASGALYVCYVIPMIGDMTESVSQYDHTVSGGLIITDDENGNVTIESAGSVTITDDGNGNVTIA